MTRGQKIPEVLIESEQEALLTQPRCNPTGQQMGLGSGEAKAYEALQGSAGAAASVV